MNFHPDVLAAHAEFGGDLQAMQALYDRPDHLDRIARLERELAALRAAVPEGEPVAKLLVYRSAACNGRKMASIKGFDTLIASLDVGEHPLFTHPAPRPDMERELAEARADPDDGLWRFWNEKARTLAAAIQEAREVVGAIAGENQPAREWAVRVRDKIDAALSGASIPAPADSQPVTLTYTNWRGETAERTITPLRVYYGATDWHPEPQWLLSAFDHDKQAERDFALKDFGPAPADKAEARREALEEAAKVALGASHSFDHQKALAECRDSESGFHSGRVAAAAAISALISQAGDLVRAASPHMPVPAGWVLVPEAALKWLDGSGPDENGHWFGDAPNGNGRGAFWWRSKFADMLASRPKGGA